jgi:hypothetical protein
VWSSVSLLEGLREEAIRDATLKDLLKMKRLTGSFDV